MESSRSVQLPTCHTRHRVDRDPKTKLVPGPRSGRAAADLVTPPSSMATVTPQILKPPAMGYGVAGVPPAPVVTSGRMPRSSPGVLARASSSRARGHLVPAAAGDGKALPGRALGRRRGRRRMIGGVGDDGIWGPPSRRTGATREEEDGSRLWR